MRMEKLPSTIVIHKRVDTLDSRLAQMKGQLANNPLEKNLGFFDFGKYTLAPEDAAFAFVKINDMWNEPIQAVMNSEEENSEDELEEPVVPEETEREVAPEDTRPERARRRQEETEPEEDMNHPPK
jgi:hypothetical protein